MSGKMEQSFMFRMCSTQSVSPGFAVLQSHFQCTVKAALRKGKLASSTRHLLYGEDGCGSDNLFIKISECV